MKKNKTEDIFIQFIVENKENFYRLAFSYVKNAEDALDIVQESIEKTIAKKASLKDGQSIKSWFYKIVVNTSLDFLRKHKKMSLVDEEALEYFISGENDVYQDIDLQRSLDELPMKFKSIIILRFFEDLQIDEVAEILHENTNTIKTRLYKALKLLRIKMNGSSF
ncbi:RNA polymerase subunit sigma-70 [Virgibacillus phasianinus]|uniref:RNA polymerase subunit sigma-70 n=1 Tax=Virgibacillus phasianinus TaxID=2017483 RepID=A0A220U1M2_9BACI|nr:RNA polymerase sigma factor [Virgibacillus phasianinus]ASK61912.1 RNA polymerase subunit sigma-70 [Virgibacillus phasianinus]